MLYSTGLLLLVIIPIVAPLCFYIRQKHIRHEMEERLEKEQLVTLTLTQLNWYKPDKELVIDGKMFDVHSVKKLSNQQYLVKGLYDAEEKKLFTKLNHLMKKKGDVTQQVIVAMAIFCNTPPTLFKLTTYNQLWFALFTLSTNQQLYSQYNIPVIGPPPRC